jgi:hypothetical protein
MDCAGLRECGDSGYKRDGTLQERRVLKRDCWHSGDMFKSNHPVALVSSSCSRRHMGPAHGVINQLDARRNTYLVKNPE